MTSLALASRLDLAAAEPLLAAVLARRGTALEIDASAVSHLGALCLQVLIAAAAEWRVRGDALTITPVSDAFAAALGTFGVSPEALHSPGVPALLPTRAPLWEVAPWA